MSRMKMWKTKDGGKIRIKDLTDEHLINIVRFLERKWDGLKEETLSDYPDFQGEMARYYAEREWNRVADTTVDEAFPIYNDLRKESERRGLSLEAKR